MKIHLYLIILFLLTSCSKKNNFFEDFKFGRQALIEVIITNCESPKHFEIYSRHTFPYQEFKYHEKINQDTNFVISIPSNLYDFSYIKIGDNHYNHIYTIPDDTLIVKLNLDSSLNREEKIKYEGSSAEICYYFIEKMKNWKKTKGYDYYYDSTYSISEYAEKLDNNQYNDLEFLNNYHQKNNLPEWFVQREKNEIIYRIASHKLGTLRYHWVFYDSTFTPPKNYYSFLDNIQINNPDAVLSSSYYGFLALNFHRHIKPNESGSGFPILVNSLNTLLIEINKTNNVLDSRIKDILIGSRVTRLLTDKYLSFSNFEKADSLIEIVLPKMNDRKLKEVVSNYRNSQFRKLQNKASLEPGDKAPGFFLSDTSGQYYKLEDLKGKVVYINFWATYCAPCINTIPEKNKLIEEFSDYPFAFLNICLDDKPDKWKGIIENHNLNGLNLICKGDWRYTLRDKYLIQTVPHYVIIDMDGKIIENKCKKPELVSSQLYEQLNKY